MNIFLLSMTDNLQVDLKNSLRNEIAKRGNRVAYISSEPQYGERPYYISTIKDYKAVNEDIIVDYFDLSKDFSDEALEGLLTYGTIYLCGGNTYIYLNDARKRNIYPILKKHLENGGLLIGASAGSIMMTPSIDLASVEDENTPGIKDTTGFSFLDFEYHPHFIESDYNFLQKYKKEKDVKIYVCKDGDGIFCGDGGVKLFGEAKEFLL